MPLQIVRQDITKMNVDAIVNTTNEEMIGYSGVDLAVHQGAGPLLEKECAKLMPLGLGEAKITKGYNLDAKYIIHTSGPIWQGGLSGESIILKSCYLESLKLAVKKRCSSVAFPLISSGTYGYPKDKVLKFAVSVITEFLLEHELTVYLCVFDKKSYEFSQTLFKEIKDFIGDDDKKSRKDILASKCLEAEDAFSGVRYHLAPMPKMVESFDEAVCDKSLEDFVKNKDKSFAYKLFDLIDERKMTDVECYKKANVDKKTFSKIKCNPDKYKPSKQTAVAFAIALELSLDETQDLLASAGLTLSKSFTFDKIIMFFLEKGSYNIFEINEALFEFDQMLLGSLN